MTREDAIYWIKNLAVLATEKDMLQIEEALNMAIEALKDRKDEPQTSCNTCRFGEVDEGYVRCAYYSKATEQTEPQTDCAWQNDEFIPTDLASTMLKNRFKEQSDG